MSTFKYADEKISANEIMVAMPSMAIAVGILTLPSILAGSTRFSDGWISILLAGSIAILLTWMIARVASKFPNQSFISYSSVLVSRPVAYFLTLSFVVYFIAITAYLIRMITNIAHEYLFERTPVEIVALSFLLVVIYAVSGSRAGIFRLNAMFLPIIFFVTSLLILFSVNYVRVDNLLPVFTTDWKGYLKGTRDAALALTGVGILYFYMALVKDPEKAPRRAAFGMSWAVGLYVVLYLVCIAVFGNAATEVIRLPIIEIAKSIEIPGGFFERMESIFFVIWITAIFTSTMMAFDVAVFALSSIFLKAKKIGMIVVLAPFILFLALIPNDYVEMGKIGDIISYVGWGLTGGIAILLSLMYGIRGGKQRAK